MKVTGFFFAFLALLAMASAVIECPAENGAVEVKIVNPENCRTYFFCDNGTPTLQTCPEGTAFNEITGVCVQPNTQEGCYLPKGIAY